MHKKQLSKNICLCSAWVCMVTTRQVEYLLVFFFWRIGYLLVVKAKLRNRWCVKLEKDLTLKNVYENTSISCKLSLSQVLIFLDLTSWTWFLSTKSMTKCNLFAHEEATYHIPAFVILMDHPRGNTFMLRYRCRNLEEFVFIIGIYKNYKINILHF